MNRADQSQSDSRLKKPQVFLFVFFFLLSLALRAWPVAEIRVSWEDAYYYLELARSLSRGGYELLGEFHAKYLPGYPAAILVMKALCGWRFSWFLCAQIVSALSSSAAAALAALFAFRLSGSKAAGWAAGFMAAFNAHLVVYGGIPFSESFFSFLAILFLVLLFRFPLLAGAVAGFAVLTRHQGWVLAAVLAASLVYREGRKRRVPGLALAGAMGLSWWFLCYLKSGRFPFEVYAQESAARTAVMGRAGPGFLLLAFPVSGHLAALFAIPGFVSMARKKEGLAAVLFFVLICVLQGFWMFRVERYFVPLVPVVCAAGGVGVCAVLSFLDLRWRKKRNSSLKVESQMEAKGARLLHAAAGLGLLAGLSHFAGFAPSMVKQERERTRGYLQAVEFVAERPGRFSFAAYDAFLAFYHGGGREVIPSALIPRNEFFSALPVLYRERALRWLVLSDLYPYDREKLSLPGLRRAAEQGVFVFASQTGPAGSRFRLVLAKKIKWLHFWPEPGWIRPWRRLNQSELTAWVFRLDELGPD